MVNFKMYLHIKMNIILLFIYIERVDETGIMNISGVGEMGVGETGVGEMGQIIDETGEG